MARPSEEFLLAWSSLSGNDSMTGWQLISLPPAGSVEVQVGRRSPMNAEAILFCFPTAKLARTEKLPEGQGFLVEKADPTNDGLLRLAITRQAAGSAELFTTMVCDVVGAIDDVAITGAAETKLLRVLIGRVVAWQHFMSRGANALSPEAELGLAGELTFMTTLLDSGISAEEVLRGWVGPYDAPQDFLLGDGAIEVKATMSSSGFPVKIGSLEQLDDSVASPLYLAAMRFSHGGGGFTLPEIVAGVEQRLDGEPGAVNSLRERLMASGYFEGHSNHYTRRFESKERRIFSVTEGFPRLTPGSVPAGVMRALYEINLDHAGNFLWDLDAALKQLGVTG
ncbi:PD-(D/E)XK motif protein [Pseudomonas sp. Z4-20]|uniref:PD-(D/E)XK motif protein n=1 Tax=Pseudomonas sp. Z4-20 TaxID=2817414 RepID=UPI003DA844CE